MPRHRPELTRRAAMGRGPLHELLRRGQSPWYSYFRGRLADASFFRSMVDAGTIRGAVLDPVVLARLVEAGSDYRDRLTDDGVPGSAGIDRLLVEELRVGARLFEPLHRSSGGDDGFIAVDLAPEVSRRPDESLARGRRLLDEVGHRNVMVRVAGTPDRTATIETLLAAGISVAVTSLYGVEQVLAALGAVQRGLADGPGDERESSSPRSLLVLHPRRIDLVVDEMLDDRIRDASDGSDLAEGLLSQVGIATARAARAAVAEALDGSEWRRLRGAGAVPPRLCWEGTAAADPRRRDVRYVEELAGPSTVVVLAPTTIAALRDHGRLEGRPDADGPDADELSDDLRGMGIDMDEVADDLQGQEIEHRQTVSRALSRLRTRPRRGDGRDPGFPAAFGETFRESLRRLEEGRVAERMWLGIDPSGPPVGRATPAQAPWLHAVEAMREESLAVKRFARRLTAPRGRPVLLLGDGGGYLGARACADAFEKESFLSLDSTVPGAVSRVARATDPGSAILTVTSKSGDVPEVRTLTEHFDGRWRAAGAAPGERRVAVTDPGTPLHAHAAASRFDGVWLEAASIGGACSGLSRSGLVPVALAGIDVGALLARAHGMALRCAPEVGPGDNPALRLAAFLAAAHGAGRDKVTLLADGRLGSLGPWVEHLLATTTCADGDGLVPVVDEPPGPPGEYGPDRAFVHLRVVTEEDPDVEILGGELEAAGHPVMGLRVADPADIGAELFRWQMAAGAAAEIIGARAGGARGGVDGASGPPRGSVAPGRPVWSDDGISVRADPETAAGTPSAADLAGWLGAHLGRLDPPEYLAIHAYLTPTVRARLALRNLRARMRARQSVATTLAWGPGGVRSTRRLCREGPSTGAFLQIIGGQPGRESSDRAGRLTALTRAGARERAAELLGRGSRLMIVELGSDEDAGVGRLAAAARDALTVA